MLPRYAAMIPTLVPNPFHRDGWIYEEKVDGYRMLAYKDGRKVRLVSRTGVDHTIRYPGVAAAVGRLRPKTVVLDGELAVFDQQLRSRFDWLRHRQPDGLATSPVLIAFDLLYVSGRDLAKRPLRERRARLEVLLDGADRVHAVRRLTGDGLGAWEQVLAAGWEGLVAKDNESVYTGGRTREWLKVKVRGYVDAEDGWRRILT
jgi:bifunctional non-homologous end joining protein LigD